jgi:uncharacterized protein (TIGR03437 family)
MTHTLLCLLFAGAAIAPAQGPAPTIGAGGVVNAADYTAAIAPGAMVAIFGTGLAPGVTAASSVPLPLSLAGVTVDVTGNGATLHAPLFFVSPGQINFQMPFATPPGDATVQVRTAGGTASHPVKLVAIAPRLFTRSQDGKGQPILLHSADYSFVTAASPALPGEYVILLLTGLGTVTPSVAPGMPGGDNAKNGPINYLDAKVTVSFGEAGVQAAFAGLMPGFSGVYQVNVQAPAVVQGGDLEIALSANGSRSQANVSASVSNFDSRAYSVLQQPTIGVQGGAVTASGVRIDIPAGAFSGASALRLSTPSAAIAASANNLAGVYRLDDIPSSSQPIRVTLQAKTAIPDGETFLLVKTIGEDERGPRIFKAQVLNGQIVADLPATAEAATTSKQSSAQGAVPAAAPPSKVSAMLWAIGGLKGRPTASGNLIVFVPVGQETSAPAVAVFNAADTAYRKIAELGVDWSKRNPSATTAAPPMPIYVLSFSAWRSTLVGVWGAGDATGFAESEMWGGDGEGVCINWDWIEGGSPVRMENARATLGHEMLHVAQSLYDPRGRGRKTFTSSNWLWLLEAQAAWFERVVVTDPKWLPDVTRIHSSNLLYSGLEVLPGWVDKETASYHGYGAATFLQYLYPASAGTGHRAIGNLLTEMSRATGFVVSGSRYNATEALRLETLGPSGGFDQRWNAYILALARGQIYDDLVNLNTLLAEKYVHGGYKFDGKPIGIGFSAPDLSAGIVQASFDSAWKPTSQDTLHLKLNDSRGGSLVHVFLHRRNGAQYVHVGSAKPGQDWTLSDLATIVSLYSELILVVANGNNTPPLHDGSSNLSIDISAQGRLPRRVRLVTGANNPANPGLDLVSGSASFWGNYTTGSGTRESWMSISPNSNYWYSPYDFTMDVPLTWSGTSFQAIGRVVGTGGKNWVDIRIVGSLSPDRSLVSATWAAKYHVDSGTGVDSDGLCEITNLPVTAPGATSYYYWGPNVKQYLEATFKYVAPGIKFEYNDGLQISHPLYGVALVFSD